MKTIDDLLGCRRLVFWEQPVDRIQLIDTFTLYLEWDATTIPADCPVHLPRRAMLIIVPCCFSNTPLPNVDCDEKVIQYAYRGVHVRTESSSGHNKRYALLNGYSFSPVNTIAYDEASVNVATYCDENTLFDVESVVEYLARVTTAGAVAGFVLFLSNEELPRACRKEYSFNDCPPEPSPIMKMEKITAIYYERDFARQQQYDTITGEPNAIPIELETLRIVTGLPNTQLIAPGVDPISLEPVLQDAVAVRIRTEEVFLEGFITILDGVWTLSGGYTDDINRTTWTIIDSGYTRLCVEGYNVVTINNASVRIPFKQCTTIGQGPPPSPPPLPYDKPPDAKCTLSRGVLSITVDVSIDVSNVTIPLIDFEIITVPTPSVCTRNPSTIEKFIVDWAAENYPISVGPFSYAIETLGECDC